MKKVCLLLLLLAALLFACGCAADNATEENNNDTNVETENNATDNENEDADADLVYIHIYETTAAQMENAADAASLQAFVDANFQHEASGDVKIGATDGYTMETTADKVLACSVEQTAENGTMLSDAELNVKNILYIQFAKEVIVFAQDNINVGELLTSLGMDNTIPYTFSAADGFNWATLGEDDTINSEIQPVDGSVNVKVPSIPENGSVRDCLYFVPGHTQGAASSLVK